MLVIAICPEGEHFSTVLLPVLFHSEAAPAFRVSVVIIVEREESFTVNLRVGKLFLVVVLGFSQETEPTGCI